MKQRRFIQCDVFTNDPYYGNALAVVIDGDGLSDVQMALFATWTNLAETTFILPPTDPVADYKLRIFTPQREMPFAGHPTLGSCAAWLHAGGVPRNKGLVRQECGVGIVEINCAGEVPAFVAPPTRILPMADETLNELSSLLEIDKAAITATAILDNGPVWQVFELASDADVLALDSSLVKWPVQKAIGIVGPMAADAECDHEIRMLAPSSGMSEDPITGSLNAAVAHWYAQRGKLGASMIMRQGTVINRKGKVFVSRSTDDPESIMIGGYSHILIEGSVYL